MDGTQCCSRRAEASECDQAIASSLRCDNVRMIRLAVLDDIEGIRDIERRAGEQFREIGMASVADAELPSHAMLAEFVAEKRLWVLDDGSGPVAFIAASVVDDCAHIVQVSALPERRGERLGATLINHVESWATSQGHRALTLLTFRDVAWNRPYYERLGFSELTPQPGSQLSNLIDDEAKDFDSATRIAMWRRISTAS